METKVRGKGEVSRYRTMYCEIVGEDLLLAVTTVKMGHGWVGPA